MSMKRGFTLIEIIVVVGIMALATGAGLVAITRYQEGRVVQEDGKKIVTELRAIQRRALSGEKPSGCEGVTMTGYQASFAGDETVVTEAVCSGGTPASTTINLLNTTVSSSVNPIVFLTVRGGASEATINVCGNGSGVWYQILVTESGLVSDPERQGSNCP